MAGKGFVAVHIGAGYHSIQKKDEYEAVCKRACLQAMTLIKQNSSALDAVTAAVSVLEDSPYTNAGLGSNLTLQGRVECDAGIMEGTSLLFGSVGALPGIKNPVQVCRQMVQEQQMGKLTLGRIPPSCLVAEGARNWALERGIQAVADTQLITEQTLSAHSLQLRRLQRAEQRLKNTQNSQGGRKRTGIDADKSTGKKSQIDDSDEPRLLDTVGAVCIDSDGRIASAVSSGGISLKQPGRLGHAPFMGCGVWAENVPSTGSYSARDGVSGVGVSTSGCGEHIVQVNLARQCAQACRNSSHNYLAALLRTMNNDFLASPMLRHVDAKLSGALVVVTCGLPLCIEPHVCAIEEHEREEAVDLDGPRDSQNSTDATSSNYPIRLLWTHTTASMALGYMSSLDEEPHGFISRLPDTAEPGRYVLAEGLVIPL